eukprot:gene20905-biopygen14658
MPAPRPRQRPVTPGRGSGGQAGGGTGSGEWGDLDWGVGSDEVGSGGVEEWGDVSPRPSPHPQAKLPTCLPTAPRSLAR